MANHAHVVLTDHGTFGWGITSPQLPELVGGYNSYAELQDALPRLLTFGGLELEGRAERHIQRYLEVSNREVALRVAQDARVAERAEAAGEVSRRLHGPVDFPMDAVTTRAGDVLILACVPSDSLRWVLEQAGDQPVGIAFLDQGALHLFFAQNSDRDSGLGPSLFELGETLDSTVGQVGRHQTDIPENIPVRAPALV